MRRSVRTIIASRARTCIRARAALVVALGVLAGGCGPDPYYIGVMLDSPGVDAARLGAIQVNFSEGIDGRPLRLRMFRLEPTTSAEQVRDSLREWAGDSSVVAAIVTSASWSAQDVSQVLSAGGLPHLFATSEPLLAPPDPNRFYVTPLARAEGEFMAEQATRLDAPRPAVIYVDSDAGHALQAALAARLEALGAPLVAQAMYPRETDEAQLMSLVSEIAGARPNLVYWIGDVAELTAVYPTMRGLLPGAAIVANNRAETRHLYFNPQGHYTGLRFVRVADVRGASEKMQDFAFRNASWSGGETTSRDALVYDALMLLGEALRSGAHDRASVRQYLASLAQEGQAYDGVIGRTAFVEPGPSSPREFNLAEVLPGGVRIARELAPPAADDEAEE